MWSLPRSRLNGQKMRNKFWILIFVLSLGSCQKALLNEQKKVDVDLESYKRSNENTSVADVQACWKRDTLLLQLIDSVLVRSNDIKIGFWR